MVATTTPLYLNNKHRTEVMECFSSLKKQSQRFISMEDARKQVQRNEEMLATHSRYKSMR